MVNINKMYQTLPERMAAGRSALMRTTYGMGGVIKIEPDGDKIKYVLTATGENFTSVERAFNAAAALHVTQVNPLTTPKLGNKVSGMAQIMQDIKNRSKSFNAGEIQTLQNAGIDVSMIKDMQVDLLTMHAEKGGTKAIANRIKTLRERGTLHGITIMDDEGARVINMRVGNKMLSSYQSNLLLSVTGHDMLDPETFGKIMAGADSTKLAEKLMKIGKRFRSLASEREISLAGGDLASFIGKASSKNGELQFGKSMLVLDPQYELLKKMAHKELGGAYDFGIKTDKTKAQALRKYYEKADSEDFVGNVMKNLNSTDRGELMKAIQSGNFSYDATGKVGNRFASDQLMKHLEKNFVKGDATREKIVKDMFNNIEYAYDGSDLLNARYLNNYLSTMGNRASEIERQLKTGKDKVGKVLTSEEKEALSIELKQVRNIERQVKRAGSKGGLEQVTGRGHALEYGDIKTAFNVTEFEGKELNKYSMIVSKMGFKGELGFAGKTNILNLSGMGAGREAVYADPVSAAFHPEVFADVNTIEAMEKRSQTVLQEFEGAINSGTIPKRVKAMLEQAAERNIEHLPSYARGSAARNREFANAIIEMMQSGVSPNQNPTMMNMLHTFFATEAFRTKGNFVQSVLPETHRFAIDSEAGVLGTKEGKMLLNKGRGYDRISMAGVGDIDHDILKFRVSGHKMMFSADAIGPYRHALGGFDLDDKGLPKLLTYKDNAGMNRLGFSIFRQPSGPEELIFARMNMDQETIRGLFGGGEDVFAVRHFRNALDELAADTSLNAEKRKTYTYLQNILDKTHTKIENGKVVEANLSPKFLDNYEQAIYNVYERLEQTGKTKLQRLTPDMQARIAKYGSSALTVADIGVEPAYTRNGVFKAFTKAGAFDMGSDLLDVMKQNNVNPAVLKQLEIAKAGTYKIGKDIKQFTNDFEHMMHLMEVNGFEKDPTLRAAFATAFEQVAEKRAIEGADILGLYVNRSMAVGSSLNQYEAFLKGADKKVQDYMLKNYKIGMLSQETAIDLSVNFAGTRQLHGAVGEMLSEADAILYNNQGIQKALGELGIAGAGDKGMTLAVFGENSMANLGKMIGYSRAVGGDKENLLGIDEFLLRERVKGSDTKLILDNMITGMQDAQRNQHATTVDLDKLIEELKGLSATNDEDKIKKALIEKIGLGADHKYSSISKIHDVGTRYEAYLDSVRRASISRIGADDILASTSTSAEAESVARKILETHKDSLEQIFNVTNNHLKEMTELEKHNHEAMLYRVGENVLRDIGQASKLENVNMADLVNSIDKQTRGVGSRVDIGGLRHLISAYDSTMSDEAQQTASQIQRVRDYRRSKFYEGFHQDYANEVQGSLGNKTTMEELTQEAEKRLKAINEAQKRVDNGSKNMFDVIAASHEHTDTLRALTNESEQIADEMVRKDANHQAAVIRAQMRKKELEDSGFIDTEMKNGTIANMEDAIREFGDDHSLTDDMIRSVRELDDGLVKNKAVYKRIGEKMGDLKDLFKNPTIRKGTLAIGALIAGSLAYTAIRDRTHDDMTGPPLLPGGSAYESGYPNRVPQIGTFSGPGYDSGVSYKVNLYGDQDTVRRFNAAAGGLVNGNMSTTMYNRIPDVAHDPYKEMAANY